MSKKCTYKYFDRNGNPSDLYYSNKSKYGEDAAEAIFISHSMKNDDVIRPSIKPNNKWMTDKTTFDELREKGYTGPTTILMDSKSVNNKEAILAYTALNIKVTDEIKKAGNNADTVRIKDEVWDEYFEFDKKTYQVNKNKEEFVELKKDAERINNLKTEKGTEIHELFKEIFAAKKELSEEDSEKFEMYFKNGVTNFLNNNEESTLTNSDIESIKYIAKELVELRNKLNKDNPGEAFDFFPEVPLYSDKMKYGNKFVQGHADLIIHSPVSNLAYIIDYKVKADKSYENFDTSYG